jgi:hypothetical protein
MPAFVFGWIQSLAGFATTGSAPCVVAPESSRPTSLLVTAV